MISLTEADEMNAKMNQQQQNVQLSPDSPADVWSPHFHLYSLHLASLDLKDEDRIRVFESNIED